MSIHVHPQPRIFHLRAAHTSYVMKVYPSGLLAQVYWGAALRDQDLVPLARLNDRRLPPWEGGGVGEDFLGYQDTMPQEYPVRGTSEFRVPALEAVQADGSRVLDLRYQGHRILAGKPGLPGLPATYAEEADGVETLEMTLADTVAGLEVVLAYTVFPGYDALTRSVRIVNTGAQPVELSRVLSAAVDLFGDFHEIHLSGSWARERHVKSSPVVTGSHRIESTRGMSSHQHNPFLALVTPGTTEETGQVYGFNLVYSSNFVIEAEADQFGWTRVVVGINPAGFSWSLSPGQTFQAPEVVMVHSDQGLGTLSHRFHKLYRERLVRGPWRDQVRPVLINNWEATYFDFDADEIERIARAAAPLGIELFVLDDGWFGHRDKDNSSLGDWTVDRRKLPQGLADLVGKIHRAGLKFGLWFEPEMVSPDSELYRDHPDWCLHVPGRPRTEIRNQLVLDLGRPEVCQAIHDQMVTILESAPIAYVKWDMNRPHTEVWSAALPPERQGETAHRTMLGIYALMESLTSRFPNILFEGCAGGGSRFDPGILYYMPQIWTSDDTDAVERLKIQYGTSLVYPPSVMGAHVAACPSHQTGRNTPLEMRGHVAMGGVFGYELDATKFTEDERAVVKAQIDLARNLRPVVMTGTYHRLSSPWDGNQVAWAFVAPDRSEAFVTWVRVWGEPNPGLYRVRCRGLDPGASYCVEGPDGTMTIGGDILMNGGLRVPPVWGDFQSVVWKLTRIASVCDSLEPCRIPMQNCSR